jgi:hypothetical protein
VKWYIKESSTGRYLLKTRTCFTLRKTDLGDWKFHTKTNLFTHSIEDAHGFDKEKHVINFIRRHKDLRDKLAAKEIYFCEG